MLQVFAGQADTQLFGLGGQGVQGAPKGADVQVQVLGAKVAAGGMHDSRKPTEFGERLETGSHRGDRPRAHSFVRGRQVDVVNLGVDRASPDAVLIQDAAALPCRAVINQLLGREEFALGEAGAGGVRR